MLAPASSRYDARVLLTALASAVLTFLALYWINALLFDGPLDALLLLLEAIAAGFVVALLLRLDRLRRLIVPRWRMSAAVDDAANATYTLENIGQTRQRNAALLFVSVLEGEARLLPDTGIKQSVSQARLGEIHAALTNADDDATELVCTAIRQLADACQPAFPAQLEQQNELSDRPQIRMP